MRKWVMVIILISISLAGCFPTYYSVKNYKSQKEYFEKFNNAAVGKKLNISTIDNSNIDDISEAKIINDTLYFFSSNKSILDTASTISSIIERRSIPLSRVKSVVYTNNLMGMPGGLLLGGLTGVLIGILKSYTHYYTGFDYNQGKDEIVVFGTTGAFVGTLTGLMIGAKKIYIFNQTN